MRKLVYLVLTILILTAPKVFCAVEEVSPELEKSLKTAHGEPNILSIIFALLFVVALIYITGLIYSKLNIVGANAVREQIKNHDISRVVVLSTTQLGQGKNLHIIELEKKKYLIGATTDSITLLKELGESKAEKEDITIEEKTEANFDVHKKYL